MEQDSFRSFLKPVQTDNEIRAVAEKASEIWHEHFTPILGEAQVNYMLDRLQSAQAISDAITREHYRYFFILSEDEEKVGYCAVQPRGDVLYLSKLYIAKPYRGRKLASAVIKTLCKTAAAENYRALRLNCNRNNAETLKIYNRLGFHIIEEEKTAIGNGFFTDDYVLEKPLTTAKVLN